MPTPITLEQIREARAALAQPIHAAQGLPGVFYGETFFEIERRELFPKSWCAVTVKAALPNAGDMVPVDLAGIPVLVVRGADGAIRAFHNICRHRAMQLVSEPCQGATAIRCPWHSWRYDLSGKLLATPELGGARTLGAEGFDRSQLGLVPMPVGQWLDYVFVNPDASAPPFEQHIQPLKALLADLSLDGLRHGLRLDEIYRANWKLSVESGIEDYHLPFGHPQLNAHLYRNTKPCTAPGVFCGGAVAVDAADDTAGKPGDALREQPHSAHCDGLQAPPQDRAQDSPQGPAQERSQGAAQERSQRAAQERSQRAAQNRPWNARLPSLTLRDGRPLTDLYVFSLFPTGTVLIAADHVMIGMLLPDGPARTRVELHLYFDGEAADSDAYAGAREETLAMWREVLPQDFPFIEGTQATLQGRDLAGIRPRFSPYWEHAVLAFQRMVLDAVE